MVCAAFELPKRLCKWHVGLAGVRASSPVHEEEGIISAQRSKTKKVLIKLEDTDKISYKTVSSQFRTFAHHNTETAPCIFIKQATLEACYVGDKIVCFCQKSLTKRFVVKYLVHTKQCSGFKLLRTPQRIITLRQYTLIKSLPSTYKIHYAKDT